MKIDQSLYLLLAIFLFGGINSTLYAQTSGPTQAEVQSYGSAQLSEMVDLFTGDFSYKIPLFELPGPNGSYPFILSYQSGSGMNEDASWVGFGWNLSPGVISRQMRGIPDDFNGEEIIHENQKLPNKSVTVSTYFDKELYGGDFSKLNIKDTLRGTIGLSFTWDNYRSYILGGNLGVSYEMIKKGSDDLTSSSTSSLNLNFDNSVQSTISLSSSIKHDKQSYTGSANFNSRNGLIANLGYQYKNRSVASTNFFYKKHLCP